jgi:hypothetical protein
MTLPLLLGVVLQQKSGQKIRWPDPSNQYSTINFEIQDGIWGILLFYFLRGGVKYQRRLQAAGVWARFNNDQMTYGVWEYGISGEVPSLAWAGRSSSVYQPSPDVTQYIQNVVL